ncbi:MAG: nitroreductase family protein [Candidatus Thorarchaeota archaeon]
MKFNESVEKLIRKRISSRTYSNEELDAKIINAIKKILDSSNTGPFGDKVSFKILNLKELDPERRMRLGTYGLIKGANYFIVGVSPKETNSFIDYGYLMEEIILKLTELNLGTVWLGGSFSRKTFGKFIKLQENEFIPAITPVGNVARIEGVIQKITRNVIQARKRKNWNQLFFLNDFNTPLSENEAQEYAIALEMVRLGPSAKNNQPWRVIMNNDKIHFYVKIENFSKNIPIFAQLDIGIALCHFILTCQERNLRGKIIVEDPLIQSTPVNYRYITSWQKTE